MYITIDEKRNPLYLHDNPWGLGEKCLCNELPDTFTIFRSRKTAQYWLNKTKKYAKSNGVDKYWHTDTWKIVKATEA